MNKNKMDFFIRIGLIINILSRSIYYIFDGSIPMNEFLMGLGSGLILVGILRSFFPSIFKTSKLTKWKSSKISN